MSLISKSNALKPSALAIDTMKYTVVTCLIDIITLITNVISSITDLDSSSVIDGILEVLGVSSDLIVSVNENTGHVFLLINELTYKTRPCSKAVESNNDDDDDPNDDNDDDDKMITI